MSTRQEFTARYIMDSAQLLKECAKKDFPPRSSIAIAKTLLEVDKLVELIGGEIDKIAQRYLVKDEDGKLVPSEEVAGAYRLTDGVAYAKEMQELMNTKHSVNVESIEDKDLDSLPKISPEISGVLIGFGIFKQSK